MSSRLVERLLGDFLLSLTRHFRKKIVTRFVRRTGLSLVCQVGDSGLIRKSRLRNIAMAFAEQLLRLKRERVDGADGHGCARHDGLY